MRAGERAVDELALDGEHPFGGVARLGQPCRGRSVGESHHARFGKDRVGQALARADASLVSPLLTFNPAFTLLLAWPTLHEVPGLRQSTGVAVMLLGAYLLDVEEARTELLAPLRLLLHRPGTLLAIAASALWGTTTVLEKLAIDHMTPPSGPGRDVPPGRAAHAGGIPFNFSAKNEYMYL